MSYNYSTDVYGRNYAAARQSYAATYDQQAAEDRQAGKMFVDGAAIGVGIVAAYYVFNKFFGD